MEAAVSEKGKIVSKAASKQQWQKIAAIVEEILILLPNKRLPAKQI